MPKPNDRSHPRRRLLDGVAPGQVLPVRQDADDAERAGDLMRAQMLRGPVPADAPPRPKPLPEGAFDPRVVRLLSALRRAAYDDHAAPALTGDDARVLYESFVGLNTAFVALSRGPARDA